mgnify:CR=1 FL=1
MRHRIPHFQHIIGGYAAGYYSYLWSEVMDADAFQAFEEAGDVFDPKLATPPPRQHLFRRRHAVTPADAYTAFRGRLPATRGAAGEAGAGGAGFRLIGRRALFRRLTQPTQVDRPEMQFSDLRNQRYGQFLEERR